MGNGMERKKRRGVMEGKGMGGKGKEWR